MSRARRSRSVRVAAAWLVVAAATATAAVSAPSRAPRPTADAAPRALDRRVLAFREDAEPARVVAEVTATVEAHADGVHVVVAATATGPRVHGAPGPLSVHGANRITAEELTSLLARDGLVLRTRGGGGRAPGPRGPAAVVTRGRVHERRLEADGRVRHVEVGAPDGAVGVAWTSEAVPEGTTTLEVVADGRVRVRCVVRVGDGGARVLRLVQVDEHGEEVGS
ncbi:MAG: hypothetical protein JNM10_04835 [Planctomycetia bacterium]|nr:hypothetical protein [Planctomycetia bacterium]